MHSLHPASLRSIDIKPLVVKLRLVRRRTGKHGQRQHDIPCLESMLIGVLNNKFRRRPRAGGFLHHQSRLLAIRSFRPPSSQHRLILEFQTSLLAPISRTRHTMFGAPLAARPGFIASDFALAALEAACGTWRHGLFFYQAVCLVSRSNCHVRCS